MNLTISVDDKLLEKARQIARRQGTSVQEMLRGYLRTLVGETRGKDVAEELLELMKKRGGRSGGRKFRRKDAYEGRI